MTQPFSWDDPISDPLTASDLLTGVLGLLTKEECIRLYGRISVALRIKEWPITPESVARETSLKQAVPVLLTYGFEQGWGAALAAVDQLLRRQPFNLPAQKKILLQDDIQALIRSWEQVLERLLQQLQAEGLTVPDQDQMPARPPEAAPEQ
jgi:hypothetical protein